MEYFLKAKIKNFFNSVLMAAIINKLQELAYNLGGFCLNSVYGSHNNVWELDLCIEKVLNPSCAFASCPVHSQHAQ